MSLIRLGILVSVMIALGPSLSNGGASCQDEKKNKKGKLKDGRNQSKGKQNPLQDPDLKRYGIYANTAPRAAAVEGVQTTLPLKFT